jgi:hypothetical protein
MVEKTRLFAALRMTIGRIEQFFNSPLVAAALFFNAPPPLLSAAA